MEDLRWQLSLIAPARHLDGRPAQAITGLVSTTGGRQIVLQAGDGSPVILALQATGELIGNLRALVVKQQRQGSRGMGSFSNSGAGGAFESVELVKRREAEEES